MGLNVAVVTTSTFRATSFTDSFSANSLASEAVSTTASPFCIFLFISSMVFIKKLLMYGMDCPDSVIFVYYKIRGDVGCTG